MPNNHHQEDPTVIDRLLTRAEELSEQCHLKTRQKSASNNDVDIITEKLLYCTTPCFEALTIFVKVLRFYRLPLNIEFNSFIASLKSSLFFQIAK